MSGSDEEPEPEFEYDDLEAAYVRYCAAKGISEDDITILQYFAVRNLRTTNMKIAFKQHRNYEIASGVRTWNCAGPGTASKSFPEAPHMWILRRRRFRGVA
eukprot:1080233-Alexandrium_andersonii.AAC.1